MAPEDLTDTPREALLAEIQRLRSSERELRVLLDESSDPIFAFFPDGRYRYVNHAFARGVGLARREIDGKRIWDVFSRDEADKRFAVVRWVFENAETKIIEVRVPRPDGDRYYLTTVKPIHDETGGVGSVICISKDITERKHMERQLEHLARHDTLTDLANRTLFNDRLEKAIAHAKRERSRLALMALDLDRFKPVNDTFGHQAGDELLKCVAQRIVAQLRESDSAGRIGGDEFVILLPHIETENDALCVAAKIHAALRHPFEISNGKPIHISSSIGIALYPDQGLDAQRLLRQADAALYRAKLNGRDQIQAPLPATGENPVVTAVP